MINKIKLLLFLALILASQAAFSQQSGQTVRWLRVGDLHSWFSSLGAEAELARTGNVAEQQDGLRWPAQFALQDNVAGKSMWIGATNYTDPIFGNTFFPFKVVGTGPRPKDLSREMMTADFKLIGRFTSPIVTVDGFSATNNDFEDLVDEVDPDLKADRVIYNVVNSSIGITVTRRAYAFSQQNHDDYFIYEYTFKNTGIVDPKGTVNVTTLEGVYFHFQYRYAIGNEVFTRGFGTSNAWAPSNNVNWGRNTTNHVIGQDPNAAGFEMRAMYSWYGQHAGGDLEDDLGAPYYGGDGHFGAAKYVGVATIHADESASNKSDDQFQPRTTQYLGADTGPQGTGASDQFDPSLMARRYNEALSAGHPVQTHAEWVGDNNTDQVGSDAGGYTQGQGYGPYRLEHGDSIVIVMAEGVGGINRALNFEIGRTWLDWENGVTSALMANAISTMDRDEYKNSWIESGIDSLKQSFRRAIANYNGGLNIPQAPPPPQTFEVNSQGNQIALDWANNAETWVGFDGYRLYRAIGKADTFYTQIFECSNSAGNLTTSFADTTARRGFDYYYYVTSFDDGNNNDINPGVPLESSKFYTITNQAAQLQKPASEVLSDIRIVPNPFDIRGRSLQFGNEPGLRDRLAFFGLPEKCTIRLYTERGDLIKLIEHTNGRADEYWNLFTESGQLIVSGVYIAHFALPDGRSLIRKFIVVR